MLQKRLADYCTKPGLRTLMQLAGRPRLPGSFGTGFPKYLKEATENCPHRISAADFNISDASSPELCAQALSKCYKKLLHQYGAILLQGFPLGQASRFNTFLTHLEGVSPMFYSQAGGVRHAVEDKIYAASDYSHEASIEPHNEMSATTKYPKLISFACQRAGIGGESVLVDSIAWHDAMDRSVVEEFNRRGGIMYHTYFLETSKAYNGISLGADVSWKYIFQSDSKNEVEMLLKKDGKEFKWHENNALKYWYSKPATIEHHRTGQISWFNQTTMHHVTFYTEMYPETWGRSGIPFDRFPFQTYYGDGTDISPETIQHIRNAAWTVGVGFHMQKDEVLMIDNERFAHARLDYTGDRKLFAALLDDIECAAD